MQPNQLEILTYVRNYNAPACNCYVVQTHVAKCTLAGVITLVDVLENALFVHTFGYVFELTVTG